MSRCSCGAAADQAAPLAWAAMLGLPILPAAVRTSCMGRNTSHKCSSSQGWKSPSRAIKYEVPESQILPQTEVLDYLYTPV